MKDFTDFIWEENYKLNRQRNHIQHNKAWRHLVIRSQKLIDYNFILNDNRHLLQPELDQDLYGNFDD